MAVVSFSSWPWPPAVGLLSASQPRLRVSYFSRQHSSSSLDETLEAIQNAGIIACLRAPSAELAMEAACAAISGGISVLEIVMSTPGVFEVIQQLVQDHPTRVIGVGTVLNTNDAKRAMHAGAKFLMSPAMDILDYDQAGEALYIPGVMTPTEILSAHNDGARIVKVYPISALGGPQYISALSKPFSHIPMVASQGITLGTMHMGLKQVFFVDTDSIGEYIAQGASSVVLSDAIFDRMAMSEQNFNGIYQLAHVAALHGSGAVKQKKRNAIN
ncbi:uncharacterized protein LOC131163633 isoform X2 [Malania oleifera]|uniref:uncharacterized protein LOC131163633 isoform X2 n=1 Tax=Malania oleifera TaxID=397392 RepID=UPI0025AE5675|nr:uncharacterized protein LOC131163633 isoform X2 [Malania oleifera]